MVLRRPGGAMRGVGVIMAVGSHKGWRPVGSGDIDPALGRVM